MFLTGEIIHNPHVNERLRDSGIRFLSDPANDRDTLGPDDVVILPAFGVTVGEMAQLTSQGCTLVDTTCGSVLNVWKNVTRYAQDGFTAIIHGKVKHEETRATASQALKYPRGRYLVVLDRDEAARRLRLHPPRRRSRRRFSRGSAARRRRASIRTSISMRVGCANQTTMLMSESLAIGEMFRDGDHAIGTARRRSPQHFRAFDTICSATQERQDAVIALLDEQPLDLMLVVGGYNSSNTCNLARICADRVRTFHIADPDCLVSARRDPAPAGGRPLDDGRAAKSSTRDWLPGRAR